MKTIAVTLIHDKKDNEQQVNDLLDKLEPVYIDAIMDGEGSDPVQLFDHYRFKDLEGDHEVKVYQFVPRGVEIPANLNDLVSYNVFFGNDVPDKDTHWYNVALRRSEQHGADVLAYVDNVADIQPANLVATDEVMSKSGQTKIVDVKTAEQLDVKSDLDTAFDVAVAAEASIDG